MTTPQNTAAATAPSDPPPTKAAKAAAIAVPVVFMSTLIIGLVVFFYMIRRSRRRADELEREIGGYRDDPRSHHSPSYESRAYKAPTSISSPPPPVATEVQNPSPQFIRKLSSIRRPSNPVPPVKLGRLNSEPFARDQGPLVKGAVRDSGLISPGGTVAEMSDYFPATHHHDDNLSIPDERSEESDDDFEKSGAKAHISYAESDDVSYYGGATPQVAPVERPQVVTTTYRNESVTGYNHNQPAYGSNKLRTL